VVELADSTGGIATRSMQALEIPRVTPTGSRSASDGSREFFRSWFPGEVQDTDDGGGPGVRRSILDSSRFVRTSSRTTAGLGTASWSLSPLPGMRRGSPGADPD